jgi:hypothetical protein
MTYEILNTPEVDLRGEWIDEGSFWVLHLTVHVRWNKGLRKRLRHTLRDIATLSSHPVYAFQAPSCDPKKRKFIQQAGGVYSHSTIKDDGEECDLYRFLPWTIQRNKNGQSFQS